MKSKLRLNPDFPSGLFTSFRVSTSLRCALSWGRLTVEMKQTSALIMHNWYHLPDIFGKIKKIPKIFVTFL
jgi:hypothetical protein